MSAMIECEGLTKRFGTFTAVDHVTFNVGKGSIFGFLGPNGSGKSTVIRMLCGILEPSEGTARIDGHDVVRDTESIKDIIGYMSQKFSLYDELTVNENLIFAGKLYGLSGHDLDKRRGEMIGITHLEPYVDRRAALLSGGWRQRLAMACSLMHKPTVLFLDEPTAGIDPVARRELWDLLFEFTAGGMTLFVTTHYMDEAERCDRIVYILNGKLVATGTVSEVIERSRLTTFVLEGKDVRQLQGEIAGKPGVDYAGFFGAALRVSGRDRDALAKTIAPYHGRDGIDVHEEAPSLEDVFIQLQEKAG